MTRAIWEKIPQLGKSRENKTVYRLNLLDMRRSELSERRKGGEGRTGAITQETVEPEKGGCRDGAWLRSNMH